MIGQRFGKLTVLRELEQRNKDRRIVFVCLCDCGKEHCVSSKSLRNGHSKSCGCLERPKKEDAVRRHPLFRTWSGMKTRCYNKNHTYYEYYGGRGIEVCDRWKSSFQNFVDDVGERPEGTTLDRVDNNGDYGPDNFRWATHKEQAANRRPNRGWRKKRIWDSV